MRGVATMSNPRLALGLLQRTALDTCKVLLLTLGASSWDGGGGVAISIWLPPGVGGSKHDMV